MIVDEITNKLFIITNNVDNINKLSPEYVIKVDKKHLKNMNYIICSFHHMLETRYLMDKWIRDDVLRFLAFYYREDQISRIKEINSRIEEPAYIVILDRSKIDEEYVDIEEIEVPSNVEELDDLAIFRLETERERG